MDKKHPTTLAAARAEATYGENSAVYRELFKATEKAGVKVKRETEWETLVLANMAEKTSKTDSGRAAQEVLRKLIPEIAACPNTLKSLEAGAISPVYGQKSRPEHTRTEAERLTKTVIRQVSVECGVVLSDEDGRKVLYAFMRSLVGAIKEDPEKASNVRVIRPVQQGELATEWKTAL